MIGLILFQIGFLKKNNNISKKILTRFMAPNKINLIRVEIEFYNETIDISSYLN